MGHDFVVVRDDITGKGVTRLWHGTSHAPRRTMLTIARNPGGTTITLTGDVAASAATLTDAFAVAMTDTEGRLVVDIAGVTNLGIAGAGLLFGAFRAAPWGCEVVCRAGAWAPTVRLLTRGAMPVEA